MEDQNKSEPKQTKPMSERLKGRIVRGLAAVGIAASSSAPIIANAQKDSEAREALSGSAKNTLVTEATLDSSPITQINIPEKSTPAPSNFKSGDPWPIDQFAGVKRAIGLTHPEQIMSDGNSGVLTKETKEKSEVMEINVPAADLLTLPADANKRILDQANYTLPEGEKLSAIPEQGIGFKITTEDEMNQFLRTVQGQNGINNPSILQSLADGWATKVDIDGKHGQGNVYLEIEAINNGITVGIRFEKAIGEFEGSNETVPAGSIWQKGKPILSPREDIKVDPAKQKRGLFAVKVGDYKDNVNNIMKNNPNIKLNLPADNAVMWGDLVEMPQGTGLLALFDDQGRKLVFGTQETVDAHASLQGAATKVPEILPLGKEVPNKSENVPAPSEIAKTAPLSLLTVNNEGQIVEEKGITIVQTPSGEILGVNEEGEVVLKRFADMEKYNDWYKKEISTDKYVPINVYMSVALTSKDNVSKTLKDARKKIPAMKTLSDVVDTAVSVKFHDTKDTSLRNGWWGGSWNPNLHAVYNGNVPQNGEDILNESLKFAVSKASTDGGETVKLADGSVWTVKNGLDLVIRRTLSDADINNMVAKQAFTKGHLPPNIHIDQQTGKLVIELLYFNITGASVSGGWMDAMSIIMAPNDKKIGIKNGFFGPEITQYDMELYEITVPSDGQGSFTWPFDMATSDKDIKGTNSKVSFVIPK